MKFDLDCIGLSKFNTIDQKYKLVNEIVSDPSNMGRIKSKNSNLYIEKVHNYKKNMGVIIRGELDRENKFIIKDFVPYVDSTRLVKIEEIEVEELVLKNKEKEYQVNFVEPRTSLELSFSIQNVIEYMNNKKKNTSVFKGILIAGLSSNAKIIFPSTAVGEMPLEYQDYLSGDIYSKDGEDDKAEQKEFLLESIKETDLYTVMDTYIVQTEVETVYSILGKIVDKKLIKNSISNEQIYILGLKVMGIDIEVCINKKNLIGIPSVGMRFTGSCWLQGKVVF